MLTPLLLTLATVPTVPSLAAPAASATSFPSVVQDDFKERFADAGKDADKLWALYEWSLEEKSRKKYRNRILNRLVKEHPDHRQAHEALEHVEYEGKWYDSQRDLDKAMKAIAEEKGLVKFNDKWVPKADVAYLMRGLEKDEFDRWFDPVAKKKLSEGWKLQDLVWVEPTEVAKIDEGLWKCDDKWLPLEDADAWHDDFETPWVIPTERAIVWSTAARETAMKAAKQAEAAWYDMRKVFGFGGELPIPFMVVRNQRDYLRFMDGDESNDLPQLDPMAMSAMNRAAFADLWFDFDAEVYRGMGVTYWDAEDQYGDNYGIHDARFAFGLSYVESIDPAITESEMVLAEGEVSPEFAQVRITAHKLPRWFRWGAAAYASRWFVDNTVKAGGDAFWAKKWSAGNLSQQGGLLPMDDFFEFEASGGNENTAQLLLQAGAVVAYLVDGKNADLGKLRSELQSAMEKGEDTEKIFKAIRKELSSKEEQIRAFAGL